MENKFNLSEEESLEHFLKLTKKEVIQLETEIWNLERAKITKKEDVKSVSKLIFGYFMFVFITWGFAQGFSLIGCALNSVIGSVCVAFYFNFSILYFFIKDNAKCINGARKELEKAYELREAYEQRLSEIKEKNQDDITVDLVESQNPI